MVAGSMEEEPDYEGRQAAAIAVALQHGVVTPEEVQLLKQHGEIPVTFSVFPGSIIDIVLERSELCVVTILGDNMHSVYLSAEREAWGGYFGRGERYPTFAEAWQSGIRQALAHAAAGAWEV